MLTEVRVKSDTFRNAAADRERRENLVIVGNGMASYKLCERLASASASLAFRIVVLGEEQRPAYDRVHLTDFLSGRSSGGLPLASREWYEEQGIELRTGCRVIAIDRDARILLTADGEQFWYDKLVFATGSRVYVPPMEGSDLPGVFVYRTVDDLTSIREHATRSRTAAILGGGLLGLEAARALQQLGIECFIVEYGPHVLCAQLDPRAGELATEKIESLGIHVRVDTRAERISAAGEARVLHFAGEEETLTVDMVVIATGVRPRQELADACGLTTAMAGGIVVDEHLRTSDPNIFAIGDCAAYEGVSYGLVAPGYRMAEVLADNLTGIPSEFRGADMSTRLKVLGLDIAVIGDYKQPGHTVTWESEGTYRRIVIRHDRIIGASGLGDWPEVRRMQDAAMRHRRLWAWQVSRFQRAGRLWRNSIQTISALADGATVCNCMNLSCGALRRAAAEGCGTVESLASRTGASTLCGSCRPLLAELVGAPLAAAPSRGNRGLAVAALVALALCFALITLPNIPYSATVQEFPYDAVWRNGVWKQFTGFTLLGVSLAGLAMSARKRWQILQWGDFGFWRMAHGILGVAGLLILVAHTGMRFGTNMNSALMSFFTVANLVGALAGAAVRLESKFSAASGMKVRRGITWMHVVLVWPLPVLVGFHILSVYYF